MAWLPPEEYVKTIESATAFGCFYFTDTTGRHLAMRSRHDPAFWGWPGGNVERGEHPLQTAVRECVEETGIDLRVTNPGLVHRPRLLAVMFSSPGASWPTAKTGFVFDGGELTDDQLDDIVLDPEEHTEWQVRPVAEWAHLMSPQEHSRLQQVDSARRTGAAVYLPFSVGPVGA